MAVQEFSFKLLANKDYIAFYTVSGVFGSITSYAFGGWTHLLEVFFIVMALDWLTGILASIKEGSGLNSNLGFWGGVKKGLMILSVFLAHRVDLAFEINWAMAGCIYFWLANELISITENYGRLGLPFPEPFKKFISILQNKSKTDDEIKQNDTNQ